MLYFALGKILGVVDRLGEFVDVDILQNLHLALVADRNRVPSAAEGELAELRVLAEVEGVEDRYEGHYGTSSGETELIIPDRAEGDSFR